MIYLPAIQLCKLGEVYKGPMVTFDTSRAEVLDHHRPEIVAEGLGRLGALMSTSLLVRSGFQESSFPIDCTKMMMINKSMLNSSHPDSKAC